MSTFIEYLSTHWIVLFGCLVLSGIILLGRPKKRVSFEMARALVMSETLVRTEHEGMPNTMYFEDSRYPQVLVGYHPYTKDTNEVIDVLIGSGRFLALSFGGEGELEAVKNNSAVWVPATFVNDAYKKIAGEIRDFLKEKTKHHLVV